MDNILATLAAIVATLLMVVAGVVIGDKAIQAARSERAVNEIAALHDGIHQYFLTADGGYGNVSAVSVYKAGLVPSEAVPSGYAGGWFTDPWGGSLQFGSSCAGGCFWLYVGGMPPDACLRVAQYQPSDLQGMWIGGTAAYPPISEAWIMAHCSAARNYVQWQFQ